MWPRNPITYFFSRAVPLFALLFLIPWSGLDAAFGRYFWTTSQAWFSSVGKDGRTRFGSLRHPEPGLVPPEVFKQVIGSRRATEDLDTLVMVSAIRSPGHFGFGRTSSRLVAYYPIAFTVVIFLSTPLPWLRRLPALVLGLIVVHLFLALRTYVWLVQLFSPWPGKSSEYLQFHPSDFWQARLKELTDLVHFNPTVSFIAPVIIWVVVLFVMGELRRFMGQLADGSLDSGEAKPPATEAVAK